MKSPKQVCANTGTLKQKHKFRRTVESMDFIFPGMPEDAKPVVMCNFSKVRI
jgi:hypothetical protein